MIFSTVPYTRRDSPLLIRVSRNDDFRNDGFRLLGARSCHARAGLLQTFIPINGTKSLNEIF